MMVKHILVGAGCVVAVAIAFASIKYRKESRGKNDKVDKIYVDEANLGIIRTWFNDKLTTETKKGLLFYPTRENMEKWKINIPEAGNFLIQAVFDIESESVTDYREVAFSSLSPKLKELLDSNGGSLVIEK